MSGSDDEGMGSDDGGEEYHYSDVSEDDEETCTPSLPRASSGLSRQVSSQSDTEGGGSAVARLTSAARENGLAGGVGDGGVNKGMVRTAAWVSTNLSDYKIINKSELGDEHRRRVRALASLFSIPMPVANVLLIYYKWDKERVTEDYMVDAAGTLAKAGVSHMCEVTRASHEFDCDMCLNTLPPEEGLGLGCTHVFCKECWQGMLDAAMLSKGASCVLEHCPSDGCPETVAPNFVSLIFSLEQLAKWERFALQQFVNSSKNMVWCTNPTCSNVIMSRAPVRTVLCTCGNMFCFKCLHEPHEPASCDKVKLWMEKYGSESETANWLLVNTKQCPKCGVRIEKNQGCNHMTCRNRECHYEFCWICLQSWREHGTTTGGYYQCNRYVPAATADVSKAKQELERYLFYLQRFSNHDQAGKFAAKHRAQTTERMIKLQNESGLDVMDVTYLSEATEALLVCRRVLKYTYVHGYYLAAGPEKQLFEHLQEQLERSTEHLAELTEKPVDKMDPADMINFTRVTLQFLRNLLSGVEEGLTSAGAGAGAASSM